MTTSSPPPTDGAKPPQAPCDFCGTYTEIQLDARWICESCYQARASCCNEACDDE